MDSSSESRLRPHPVERFEASKHYFDLEKAAQDLQNEPHPDQGGHRQIALYHYGSVTMVLFVFEAGSSLPKHTAQGLAVIHALEGELTVRAEDQTYDLTANGVVVLNPGVPHSVEAKTTSRMLLTVHLGGEKTLDSPRRPEAVS